MTDLENNKDLFYDMGPTVREGHWKSGDEKGFLAWWMSCGGRLTGGRRTNWASYNPVQYALAPLRLFGPRKDQYFAVILAAEPGGYTQWLTGGATISAVVGGAIQGALYGMDAFSPETLRWAGRLAKPWFGMTRVVDRRLKKEAVIISMIDTLKRKKKGVALLHEKICGNILAGAIGNAMGSPVEGKHYWEIDEKHPKGITTVLQPERLEAEDDNQMAMLLTETYLEREGRPVMARHFGKTWRDRLNRDHFFTLCMGNAYDMIRDGWDPRITGHWSVVTGSTVMCMEPVGIYNIADPEYAFIDAKAVSYMYQRGLDMLAAANMAATVAEALRPDATVDSVCRAALDTAPTAPLRTFDKRKFKTFREYLEACIEIADKYDDVLKARKELYDKCLLYHMIDPLELWGYSLAMFRIAKGDVRQAAIGGTNIGRDSDTISGRAAMLSGTLRGASNVPKKWIRMFKPESLAKIRRNAQRFADVVIEGKLAALKKRRQIGEGC